MAALPHTHIAQHTIGKFVICFILCVCVYVQACLCVCVYACVYASVSMCLCVSVPPSIYRFIRILYEIIAANTENKIENTEKNCECCVCVSCDFI